MKSSDYTKEKIIYEASKLFHKFGIAKTTTEDIANALNMGKSNLYYYFKNKEDILAEALDREINTIKEKIRSEIQKAELPQDRLKIFVLTRMKFIKELALLYRSFREEYHRHYSFIQRLRARYDAYETGQIREILEAGVGSGAFVIGDIPLTAATIFTAMKGLEYDWAVNSEIPQIEYNTENLLDILLHGIIARPEQKP